MIGIDAPPEHLSLEQMLGMNPVARIGLTLTKGLSLDTVRKISASFTPPPSAGSGISLSLNKRLSSRETRRLLDWTPTRTDILHDIEHGSYRS